MARALWSGSISFGLVTIPVALVSGVRDRDLHFRQLHEKDGAPIEVQRWCSKEDIEVPYEEIVRGYELEDGGEVLITDEELESVEPRRSRTIEIEQFVDLDEVDPIYFDHPYLLLPASDDDGGTRAYHLLARAMEDSERAAVGRFAMRARDYLAIMRTREGALTLTTMLFADEVRSPKDVDGAAGKAHKPSAQQLRAAVAVIEALSVEWKPDNYKDRYRRRLQDVVARKRKGKTVKAPERSEPETSEPPDLMAALERTLAELKGGAGAASR